MHDLEDILGHLVNQIKEKEKQKQDEPANSTVNKIIKSTYEVKWFIIFLKCDASLT